MSKGDGGASKGVFGRSGVRILRKAPNGNEVGGLGRWLRGLGGGGGGGSPAAPEGPTRVNPAYHSEGKGSRRRGRHKDRRRLSFHEPAAPVATPATPNAVGAVPNHNSHINIRNGRVEAVEEAGRPQPAPAPPLSRSTPNLQQLVSALYLGPQQPPPPPSLMLPPPSRSESVGSLPASSSSGLSSWGSTHDTSKAGWEQAPTPPVRDASSVKAVRYGAGHEKFPSWPVPAAPDHPQPLKHCCQNNSGSLRSKSWTDGTEYGKDSSNLYSRTRRPPGGQLKPVLERAEAAMFAEERRLPSLDREGQPIGDRRYLAPSPPQRDVPGQKAEPQVPHLTQAEVEEYARTYDAALLRQQSAELFGGCPVGPVHQSQGSYAHSEGYHSYVSSTDSTNTPFMDRLRQEQPAPATWDDPDIRWRGSLSDVSVASGTMASMSTRQLIAHSSRVQTPQRHLSESVLILSPQHHWTPRRTTNHNNNRIGGSVAERVSELERAGKVNLKAVQKQALLSFYERQHKGQWKSEPHLPPPPPAPPRSAAVDAWRRPQREECEAPSGGGATETSADLLGPLLVGAPILLDSWVPERPPKKPHLRSRPPPPTRSPEPPPPPTPPPPDARDFCDEPLPPPPPDIDAICSQGVGKSGGAGVVSSVEVGSPGVEGSYKRTAEAAVTVASAAPRTSVATSAPVGGAAHAPARPLRPLHANPYHPHLKSGLDGVARHLAQLAKPLPPKKTSVPSSTGSLSPVNMVTALPSTVAPSNTVGGDVEPMVAPLTAKRILKPPPVPPPPVEKEAPTTPVEPIAVEAEVVEEDECAKLSRHLGSQLAPSNRLKDILAPAVEKIKATEFVEGLFAVRPLARTRPLPLSEAPPLVDADSSPPKTPETPLPASSAYFTISEPKALFLTRYSKHINSTPMPDDIQLKKEELVSRLSKKLSVLKEERDVMAAEARANESLGAALQRRLTEAARHQEAAKLALHVDEVGKITSLLLGLSGRLARVENALANAPPPQEKEALLGKREKLTSQLSEAKFLKECIDRRSAALGQLLARVLDAEASADLEHFVLMKASLQVGARELDDRVRLGEEQLAALNDALA